MQLLIGRRAAVALVTAACALAQNRVQHFDGTPEATSRGAAAVAAKTVLQRYPDDQVRGRTALSAVNLVLQDQDIATPELFMLEIRGNDPAGPPTGAPDMAAAGLIAAVPVAPVFPGPGPIAAISLTIVFAAPVLLGPSGAGPANDFYVGVAFPPSPLFPADGISVHCSGVFFVPPSVGEQMSPAVVGYAGVLGEAGLGWEFNGITGALGVAAGNRAWRIAPAFVDDVCQPFADNAVVFTGVPYMAGVPGTGTGLNPNFGYAGLYPVPARADAIGWRVRASTPVGSLALALVAPATMPPLTLPFLFDGSLCLDLTSMTSVGFAMTVAGPLPGTSEVTFGPFAVPGLGGAAVYAQGVTVDPGTLMPTLTTMCRTIL